MYWEGGPPTDEADRLDNSTPILFSKLLAQRATAVIKQKDAATLDGLRRIGYNLNFGEDESGFMFLALKRAGGYYLGASRLARSRSCMLAANVADRRRRVPDAH